MPRPGVYLLLLVAASGSAAAQHARYPREQPAPPPAELSDRVKPLTPNQATAALAKPAIETDAVLSIESLRTGVREEQEQILVQLIQSTPDSEHEEKADYYFRLGEHYAQQQRIWRIKYAEYAARTSDADRRAASQAATQAKMFLLKTVKTFKGLVDNETFRAYPKLDVALFYYAYTLQGGKYMKEARAVYDKLLKNYPNSKYVPEAHLAFADYYFEAGQLADAEARYTQVIKFPKSQAYAYALHKLAWIHVQLSRFSEAVETYAQVVSATRGDANHAELHRAARADLARAYARIDKADPAYDRFHKLDPSAAVELVEVFADVALETGAYDRAVRAYRELLARGKGDACRWQYRIAHAALSMPVSTKKKLEEIEALVRMYAKSKTPTEGCRDNAAAMSGELAAAFHAEWAKTQNAETLAYAEQLYAMHVKAFPDAAAERAMYAEVLWTRADRERDAKLRRERWRRAAETFAKLDSQDAARAAALAWMNALDFAAPTSAKVSLGQAPRSAPKPLAMSERDAKLVAAVTEYLRHDPEPDAELAQMRLAVATLLRRQRHFDEAVTVLDQFLEHHQEHASAELAANWLLDSLVQARRLDDVREAAAAIAADTPFVTGKPELQRNLQLVRSRASR